MRKSEENNNEQAPFYVTESQVNYKGHVTVQFIQPHTRAIPKVSGLDILDNNIFHNLYISETHIF